MNKCIYCGIDHDLSESDIIPDALTNARILNRNVCRIEHNNKFSDMFESKVIDALSFITNELDIKSSKGKKYAPYEAVVTIACFLQALFGQNCKIFLDIVAKRFWTLLHVQIGQSCNAPAGCVINQP